MAGNPLVLVFHFEREDVSVEPPSSGDPSLHHLCRSLFTVSDSLKRAGQRTRVVVRFVGLGITSPDAWACSDCGSRCCHIKACQERLRELCLVPDLGDGEDFLPKPFHPQHEMRHLQPELERHNERSVSSLPRPSIPFAVLPGETPTFYDVDYSSLLLLHCSAVPRCRCGTETLDLQVFTTQPCTIYDMDRAYSSHVRLHLCSPCEQFTAGPDLGQLGLFNIDNRTIVTQRLIHKYDIYFSGQQGTFSHFCNLVSREYEMKRSVPPKFIPVDEFRRVWFSYVRLQGFNDNKQCPICKESPYCIIGDGVTIATLAAKATGSIVPPTVSPDAAPVRRWTRPVMRSGGHQLVPDRKLRKLCIDLLDDILGAYRNVNGKRRRRQRNRRRAVNWTALDSDQPSSSEEEQHSMPPRQTATHEAVLRACNALIRFCPSLSVLAEGIRKFASRESDSGGTQQWLLLLRQVSYLQD